LPKIHGWAASASYSLPKIQLWWAAKAFRSHLHNGQYSKRPKSKGGQQMLLVACPKFNSGQRKLFAATYTTDNIPSAQNPKAGSKCFLQLDQNSTAGSERTISQAPKIRGRAANGFLTDNIPSAQNPKAGSKCFLQLAQNSTAGSERTISQAPKIQGRAANASRSPPKI
jgi:hypothetical protein